MLLGLFAGDWLRSPLGNAAKVTRLIIAGVVCFAIGWTADAAGVCPSVKRIWTPSWVLVSGGYCFTILAVLFALIDWAGFRSWPMPLRVVGMNSIAAYCLAELVAKIGHDWFDRHSAGYEPLVIGGLVLIIEWLILYGMDRRRMYVRI
jgi:predicted acyltransferase